jgi:hypothetical protein
MIEQALKDHVEPKLKIPEPKKIKNNLTRY